MSRLLLTSAGFENPHLGEIFLELLGKSAEGVSILFIPTAAITEETMIYAERSKEELLSLGIKESNIRTFNMEYKLTYDEINGFDAMYVCGGYTLHLLNKVKEAGFDSLIMEFINNGKLYLGVSAGSIIVGPTIQGTPGLNIIDKIIFPHYCEDKKEELKMLEDNYGHSVIPLTDNQAVLVENEVLSIVE